MTMGFGRQGLLKQRASLAGCQQTFDKHNTGSTAENNRSKFEAKANRFGCCFAGRNPPR